MIRNRRFIQMSTTVPSNDKGELWQTVFKTVDQQRIDTNDLIVCPITSNLHCCSSLHDVIVALACLALSCQSLLSVQTVFIDLVMIPSTIHLTTKVAVNITFCWLLFSC
jgi:hypothetical protein